MSEFFAMVLMLNYAIVCSSIIMYYFNKLSDLDLSKLKNEELFVSSVILITLNLVFFVGWVGSLLYNLVL